MHYRNISILMGFLKKKKKRCIIWVWKLTFGQTLPIQKFIFDFIAPHTLLFSHIWLHLHLSI